MKYHNTQPLFPICKRYTYEHVCFAGDRAQVPVLDKCFIIKIYPQPCKVNFLSRTSDLDKQLLLCCSLKLVFN